MSRFNKLVVCFVFMLVLTVLTVFGDNSTTYVACSNNQSRNLIPCSIITPYVTGCSNFTYNIAYGGVVIEREMLINLSGDYYRITFNHTMLGDYFIWLCNGDTAWMNLHEGDGSAPGTITFNAANFDAPICPDTASLMWLYTVFFIIGFAFVLWAFINPAMFPQFFAGAGCVLFVYTSYNIIGCYPKAGVILFILSLFMMIFFFIRGATSFNKGFF